MLANLAGFDESERIAHAKMPELERFVLARLAALDRDVRAHYESYDFTRVFSTVFNFATNDLSAFYFDIRKDVLYCDKKSSARRRAARTVDRRAVQPSRHLARAAARVSRWKRPGPRATARTTPCISIASRRRPPNGTNEALLEDLGARARSAPRRHRRARTAPRGQGDRLQPRSDADALCRRSPTDAALFDTVDLAEIAITSGARVEIGKGPPDAFRLPDVAGRGRRLCRCRRREMRPLLDGARRRSGTMPGHADLCRRCSDAVGS